MKKVISREFLHITDSDDIIFHISGRCHVGIDKRYAARFAEIGSGEHFEKGAGHTHAGRTDTLRVRLLIDRTGYDYYGRITLRPLPEARYWQARSNRP